MRNRGFTMVEMVLAMSLIAIVVTVSGFLMGRGVDAYRLVTSRIGSGQEARYAFLRMRKEMEFLRAVTEAQPTSVTFTDPTTAAVNFRMDGTTLYRDDEILAEGVTNLGFTYYRDNGNETLAAPQVRRIHMEMTVSADQGAGTIDLRTDVFPREYMYIGYFHEDFQP